MNILIMISNPPFDGTFGGAENFAKEISISLSARGHNVHLLCRKISSSLPNYEKINGVHIYRYSYPKISKLTWLYTNPKSMFCYGKKIINKENIDVIYCIELYPTGWIGAKLGKKYNLPVILSLRNVHKYYLDIISGLPLFIKRIVERRIQWTLEAVNKIQAVSKSVKKSYIDKFNIPDQKICVITNGINIEKFRPSIKIKSIERKLKGYYPIIVYPARFDRKQKRHDVVIETVRILKKEYGYRPFAYLIGGGNPHHVNEDIKSKNLEKNFFVGKIPHEKIIEVYQASDICLFPTNYEGFSMALLEIIASGLPVIATDLPEIREVVDESNGVLIEKNDPNLFAKEVVKLCENKNLLKKKGINSRKKALKYSWNKIVDKIEKMIMETAA